MADRLALMRRIVGHAWTDRRLMMVEQLMAHAADIDAMEYGRVTLNLGPASITTEINRVFPKIRVDPSVLYAEDASSSSSVNPSARR